MAGGYETIATVKSIKVEYDVTKQWGSWNPTFDIFMTVTYNDGQDWDKELEIKGNLKRELGANDPKSWGSAFKVKNFFQVLFNEKELFMNDDWSIPEKWLDVSVGRQFKVCSYKTTNLKISGNHFLDTFDIVASANAPEGTLKKKVLQQVKDGWIKNYFTDDMSNDLDVSNKPTESKKENADVDFSLDI